MYITENSKSVPVIVSQKGIIHEDDKNNDLIREDISELVDKILEPILRTELSI